MPDAPQTAGDGGPRPGRVRQPVQQEDRRLLRTGVTEERLAGERLAGKPLANRGRATPVEEMDAVVGLDDDHESGRLRVLVRRGRVSRVEPQIVGRDGHEG